MLDLRDPDGTGGFKRLNAPGGSACRDGPIEDALFNYPKDIKFDNDGNMFVADYGNHCIRMISADNIVTTVDGQPGVAGYKDGGPVGEWLSMNRETFTLQTGVMHAFANWLSNNKVNSQ